MESNVGEHGHFWLKVERGKGGGIIIRQRLLLTEAVNLPLEGGRQLLGGGHLLLDGVEAGAQSLEEGPTVAGARLGGGRHSRMTILFL